MNLASLRACRPLLAVVAGPSVLILKEELFRFGFGLRHSRSARLCLGPENRDHILKGVYG